MSIVGWAAGGASDFLQDVSLGAPEKRSWASCWPAPFSHPDPLSQEVFAKEQTFPSPLSRCFISSFICSFNHSFIYSFVHSSIHPRSHSFIHSFVHPLIYSSTHSFTL